MFLGQGVVLERSVFSDAVIGQSLYENNFLSDEAFRLYLRDLVPNTIAELWRPHVMIYLDKSPEDCLKTIKEEGKVLIIHAALYRVVNDIVMSIKMFLKNIYLKIFNIRLQNEY